MTIWRDFINIIILKPWSVLELCKSLDFLKGIRFLILTLEWSSICCYLIISVALRKLLEISLIYECCGRLNKRPISLLKWVRSFGVGPLGIFNLLFQNSVMFLLPLEVVGLIINVWERILNFWLILLLGRTVHKVLKVDIFTSRHLSIIRP